VPVAVLSAQQLHGRQEELNMTIIVLNRRNLIAAGGSALATGFSGLLLPARAEGVAPTPSMSGGSNNYFKGAPIVDRIGKGGFLMTGTVRRAGDGAPLAGQRIQIWAHTTEGREEDQRSHGATVTDKNGAFRLEIPQIVPIFGQPHGHLAYDSGEFQTVFLRPVMRSAKETSLEAHFVLQPA
jgi:protocatechuate 3,4-dioxygenase beta subunit